MLFQFMESDQEADGIMLFCAGKAKEQVAVPAPGRVRVGKMAQVVRCAVPVVSVGAGMGMYGGAVPGDGKVLLRYETAFHGRQDGSVVENY